MSSFNIYLCGVGGQGIGMLSEVLSQACLAAGHKVRGCDTHGLAQRGGSVVSHIRLGDGIFTPRVQENEADLVLALERFEAYQATLKILKAGGAVVYYDAQYQPIHVRMGLTKYPTTQDFDSLTHKKNVARTQVFFEDLKDPKMQNVALLGKTAALGAIEGVTPSIMRNALSDALPKAALEANLALFERALEEQSK